MTYQFSKQSSLYLISLYEIKTGKYMISLISNSMLSVLKQVVSYAKLTPEEEERIKNIIF